MTKMYHSSRQPGDWLAQGADFLKLVKTELGVGKSITGLTGGQCTRLECSLPRLWKKLEPHLSSLSHTLRAATPVLEKKMGVKFADCPLHELPFNLQIAFESSRCCNIELSSANPNIDRLQAFIEQYRKAIEYLAHPSMLRPVRYTAKLYDHMLSWHLLDVARSMEDDQALSLGALSSGALESLNKYLKAALRQNVGGGRQDTRHSYSNERLVKAFRTLSADLRCVRQRWYMEQEERARARQ